MKDWSSQEAHEQMSDIQKLTTKIAQRTQNCASDILNECMTVNGRQLDSIGKVTNPAEALPLQTRLLREQREQVLNASQKVLHVVIENIDDFNQIANKWSESGMPLFNPLKLWPKNPAEASSSSTSKK